MAEALESLKATLEGLLERMPSQETWGALVDLIEQAWTLAPAWVVESWVPLLERRLAGWPPGLRNAPLAWVEGVGEGRAPLLATADTFEAAKKLKPAPRRQWLDSLVERAPGAARNVLAYFVRVEDRTMMKQLGDFGALAAPGIVAALREREATEKRYETLAELAIPLGPAVRDAAGTLADLVVMMRARRPSQKTMPALQRLAEALVACDAPEEDVRRAMTPLLDYVDGALRGLARRALEARGLPAPHSPWEACAVGWPLIAELQRLGCSFDPEAPRSARIQTTAGEVDVPRPFQDLLAVTWPGRDFRGSEWMFSDDAHSELSVHFRLPYFPDMEAYGKRPYLEMATDGCGGYYYHLCLEDVPATLDDAGLAGLPVYRLERGGEWAHRRGPSFSTLQTFLSNLTPL